MKRLKQSDSIEVLWFKTILYSLLVMIILIAILVAPKQVFDKNMQFQLATSMAILDDSNLILYEYDVYSTMNRFESGLINDVNEVKQEFISRNEILAIKIYGETLRYDIKDDYILIYSPDVPDLNIEYHLVQNLNVAEIVVPCRTFIMLYQDVSKLINNVYISVLFILSISIIFPISIKTIRMIVQIKKYKIDQQTQDI